MLLFYCVLTVSIKLVNSQKWLDRKPVVRTTLGVVEGITLYTDSSKPINAFLGIPYASAPIDNLRFLPPTTHPGWNTTYKADKNRDRCAQLTPFPQKTAITYSEDCLYLNVWTPTSSGPYPILPVIVFLEGSDFFTSSSLELSGQDLAVEGAIVVTINYRLNVFGFFCLGTAEARGNLGLLDQYFGLVWLKENIYNFGGDINKITLFGYASGAVSTLLHMISPRTSGLFQRAILTSSSAVAPWQIKNDPIVASTEVLRILGCNLYTTNYIACLQSKKTEDILQALREYSESSKWTDMFLPVIDTFLSDYNRYLPMDPTEALRIGAVLRIPILTGISKPIIFSDINEWVHFAKQDFPQFEQYIRQMKISEILKLYRIKNNIEEIIDLIAWRYITSYQNDAQSLLDQLKKLYFEAKVEAPHYLQLHYLSPNIEQLFAYYIEDIEFVFNNTDFLISSEILLLFGPTILRNVGRRRFLSNEQKLSILLKHTWIDFAILGNPGAHSKIVWPKYSTERNYVQYFNTETDTKSKISSRNENYLFWNELIPKFADKYKCNVSSIPRELQISPDPAAGFRHAMYTLVAVVIALLGLLIVCIILLKRREKERCQQFHLGY